MDPWAESPEQSPLSDTHAGQRPSEVGLAPKNRCGSRARGVPNAVKGFPLLREDATGIGCGPTLYPLREAVRPAGLGQGSVEREGGGAKDVGP